MSTEALPSASVSLEEIVASNPTTALYLPLAERLLSRGQVAEAVRLCEERRGRPGKGVGDHIVLGRCYLADGRLSDAREQFQAALQLDRENVVALKSLAGILSHDGRHAEAADLYRAVCRVDAGDLESQSALHQITSGDYPEVRPPEVIVSQGDLRWQPVRLTREEDHLSELGLGLRTFESMDAGALRPSLPAGGLAAPGPAPVASGPAPAMPAMPSELPWPVRPEEMILSPDELIVGPQFPHEPALEKSEAPAPRRPEVVGQPAAEGGLNNRLGTLDVQGFQVSALERLDDALRPVEIRELGEVGPPEVVAEAAIAPSAPAEVVRESAGASPTRSAVWGDEPATSEPATAEPAAAEPAASAAPVASKPRATPRPPAPEGVAGEDAAAEGEAPRQIVEGNRTAFETWLRRLGGK